MSGKTRVYLRADGNSQIGLGHLHRLIALGQVLTNDFDCVFVLRSPLPGIKELILQASLALKEVDADISLEREAQDLLKILTGDEIVVLDGYHFDTAYQRQIRAKGSQLICVDDLHEIYFNCDIIINPAGGVDPIDYDCVPFTRIFTGPSFAFLKKPFLSTRIRSTDGPASTLLICMGGADPENNTLSTLMDHANSRFKRIIVIIGEAYRHRAALDKLITTCKTKVDVRRNLSPEKLAESMEECGVAVTSASGIAYEYLSVGGELYIKQTADNQRQLYHYLITSHLAFPYNQFRVGRDEVARSGIEQKKIFDGASDRRLLKIIKLAELSLKMKIRTPQASDLHILFQWANEPELRRQSYNERAITFEEHSAWFAKKISDPNSVLYIFELETLPIAQVRFDLNEGGAVISFSIDKDHRGRGLGQSVLTAALRKFTTDHPEVTRIIGFVKMTNSSSMRIFENLRFVKTRSTGYWESYRYEYTTK